ncbi:hypothetical protein QIJ70_gp1 [ssRNA phage Gerhypos.1_9]|uniref:Uncharacterized protein n=2 Tax=Fiersviridae TaxID=2842319 RepID=A0A8S5KZ93_9VIRU|nr:hypothetical protein QIJ70_gp1 [ssRNA phage Gerhypos.1_9]QDH86625.1 MAG: hypothetical protein H1Bulk29156_000001 [Leviviridae sp.]DAD50516.1 TPA_asm: hypothetical protein [ssRNA phage Gerhypos.1_9]
MRNFNTRVQAQNTHFLDVRTVGFTDDAFVAVQQALVLAMEATNGYLSPSEEETLSDFITWWKTCRSEAIDQTSTGWVGQGDITHPVFTYVNLNAGYSVAVVAIFISEFGDFELGFRTGTRPICMYSK